jgi:tetratricopeptide (TPR) repeat protein
MREGFAVFFSTLYFDDAGKFAYEENLAWLETVKNIANPPSPGEILMADVLGIPDEFQSLAWSMVSFLLNSGKRDYLRTVTDSFMLLSDTNSAEENAEVVMKRIFLWNNMEDMTNDYREYLDSRKTFNELLARGQQAYTAGEKANAIVAFRAAVDQRPTHFAPWYYLGLLAYEMGDHDSADEYYHSSIRCGADSALVHYALGLNAAAAGKNNEAVDFLRLAAAAAPDRYQEKANALIARLGEK